MLKLEITESAYTDNPYQLLNVMKKFQNYGIKILMDDFGSGYSSLSMLKNVIVDTLKVDMNFVQDLENSQRAAAIVEAVVQLAKNIHMDVIIEGVETKAQIDFLESIGCDLIQGYYFSRPVPEEEFIKLLDEKKNWRIVPAACGKWQEYFLRILIKI